ncbi:LLM class flavin-dependent oxidoreductase [Nonomuraea jabiensis]|uniref:LLM class flavin-dependent oxidoreductase n=1 Tax=Nonomuraea jabiensis TaxID=882448 RepID=UPI00368FF03F
MTLPITTAVTCPLVRIHPAVIAQAAATSAVLTGGPLPARRGHGRGAERAHHRLPPAAERLEMLEEAIEVMRRLWSGELTTHRGTHYSVDTVRPRSPSSSSTPARSCPGCDDRLRSAMAGRDDQA